MASKIESDAVVLTILFVYPGWAGTCLPPAPGSRFSLEYAMTLTRFVTKNAFRNKRRSTLTVLSIAFSLLLLTFMMTLWHAFALDDGSAESPRGWWCGTGYLSLSLCPATTAKRFAPFLGSSAVVPVSWFQGIYKDQKPENFFPRFGTDPDEFLKVFRDLQMPDDQVKAWQRDRQGAIVD